LLLLSILRPHFEKTTKRRGHRNLSTDLHVCDSLHSLCP
jgi:hypothetical protein